MPRGFADYGSDLERSKVRFFGRFVIARLSAAALRKVAPERWIQRHHHALVAIAASICRLLSCDAEESHQLLQLLGLSCQFFGSAGKFFRRGCITLRDRVDLGHGLIDLRYSAGLFGRGRGNILDKLSGLFDRRYQVRQETGRSVLPR